VKGLTEGRVVHYVLRQNMTRPAGAKPPGHRPAIVVRDWDEGKEGPGTVNLQVFLDGTNDRDQGTVEETSRGIAWRTSVPFSAEPKPGTWHWPERTASDEAERKRSDESQGG
jgi:hypothetical protein